MKVAVLGCGPAGLLAAHAATIAGAEVTIFSKPERSHIHGAQYVHEAIPDICESEPTQVSFAKLGVSTGYAEKVYASPLAPTSWADFPMGEVPAWPMVGVYSLLWTRYAARIRDKVIEGDDIRSLVEDYDLVFSSIPRPAICRRTIAGPDELAHQFKSAAVIFEPHCFVELDNVVLYSGRPSESWYRTSRLFGHAWTEYPARVFIGQPLPSDWLQGMKPTEHDCTCHDYPNLVHIGRFGTWNKGILVSDAFDRALDACTAFANGVLDQLDEDALQAQFEAERQG